MYAPLRLRDEKFAGPDMSERMSLMKFSRVKVESSTKSSLTESLASDSIDGVSAIHGEETPASIKDKFLFASPIPALSDQMMMDTGAEVNGNDSQSDSLTEISRTHSFVDKVDVVHDLSRSSQLADVEHGHSDEYSQRDEPRSTSTDSATMLEFPADAKRAFEALLEDWPKGEHPKNERISKSQGIFRTFP